MNIRRNALFASFVTLAIAASVGCSAAPPGDDGTVSAEAVTGKCPIGTSPVYDMHDNLMCVKNAPIVTLAQKTGAPLSVAAATSAGTLGTCGASGIAIPEALRTQGCSTGVMFNGAYVWACPVAVDLSASLGVVLPAAPRCFYPMNDGTRCEYEYVTSAASNCFGAPVAGWTLVVDEAVAYDCGVTNTCVLSPGGCKGSGCNTPHPIP